MTITAFWSLKGGAGTTTACTSLAILTGRHCAPGALLVDLAGDVPAVLGLADRQAPGVSEWLHDGEDPGTAAYELRATSGLAVLCRGNLGLPVGRGVQRLGRVLANDARHVLVDCGPLGPYSNHRARSAARSLARVAQQNVLVTGACALALDQIHPAPAPITAVVVLREEGRSFGTEQIERLAAAPVVAEVDYDPAIARCLDTGGLGRRLPPSLERALIHSSLLPGHGPGVHAI